MSSANRLPISVSVRFHEERQRLRDAWICHIHGWHVERLEHDLHHELSVGLGVHRSIREHDGMFLKHNPELVVEGDCRLNLAGLQLQVDGSAGTQDLFAAGMCCGLIQMYQSSKKAQNLAPLSTTRWVSETTAAAKPRGERWHP